MAPSESSKPAAASRSNNGDVHVQGAMQQYPNEGGKVDLHNNPNDAPTSLAGYTTQSFPMNSHVMMPVMQPSLSQSYPQQVVGMYPTNIFWDTSSNMHLLAPSAASASVTNQPGNPPYLSFIPNTGSFYEHQLQLIQQQQRHGLQQQQEQQQRPQHPIHNVFQTLNQQPSQRNASFLSSNQVASFLPSNSIVTGRYQTQHVNTQSWLPGLPNGPPIGSGAWNSPSEAGRKEDTSLAASSQNSDNRTGRKPWTLDWSESGVLGWDNHSVIIVELTREWIFLIFAESFYVFDDLNWCDSERWLDYRILTCHRPLMRLK